MAFLGGERLIPGRYTGFICIHTVDQIFNFYANTIMYWVVYTQPLVLRGNKVRD